MNTATLADVPTLDELARTRLRQWFQTTGITQTDAALRIGRTQTWLSRYLKAEFDADLETLQKMAGVFGQSLTALFDLPGDPMEAQLIALYRAMRPTDRAALLNLLQSLAQPSRRRQRRAGAHS